MITDRLMKPGQWDVKLDPGTPKEIRDLLAFFGHIYIFDGPIDVRLFTDATLKAAARYAGILTRKPNPFELGGPGLIAWLGDETGKGDISEANIAFTNGTFAQWVAAVLPASIAQGTVTAIAGTHTATIAAFTQTPRASLDYVMTVFGGEFRVKPDATLDAGPSSALFATTPTTVIIKGTGGRDGNINGLDAPQFDYQTDADDYWTRVLLNAAGGYYGATIGSTPYKDLRGNTLVLKSPQSNSIVPAGAAQAFANSLRDQQGGQLRQTTVNLSTDQYDVPYDVATGDWVYVYDPSVDLYDQSNSVFYRGQLTYPLKLRVLATTWRIERGLTVAYRDLNGVYTDLSPWIGWEGPGTTFEIGAANRRLSQ